MIKAVQHLATLFAPSAYTLQLDLTHRVERTFRGTVIIHGRLQHLARTITLHSKDLVIEKVMIDNRTVAAKADIDDQLILQSNESLAATEHTISLTFSGTITDTMYGLYPCYFTHDGQAKELLMTQLEPHYAREVFPCIDEPAAKAIFSVTVLTERGVTVLGNTPVSEQHESARDVTTTFETTPKMSPYLLALVVGELDYLETKNKHGVTVRAYATPDKVEQARFALDCGARILDYYDDYFGTPYPLPKCDMVAVPDFSAGAMENWGLITYRESCMLFDEKHSSTDTKEYIAIIVAHELSHQWFGNLVTMQWWDDLWLNESFANFMEHYAVDHFFPEWQTWEQFSGGEQQYAFNRDSLAQVQAVKQPVHHPDELHALFDPAIVYAKGSCLIRMLHDYLGAEAFRDGLRVYMKQHRYGNTTADDLWKALASVSHKDISSFMHPWLLQAGHPMVSVSEQQETVTLEQERFYANPTQSSGDDGALWPIPLLSTQLDQTMLVAHEAVIQKKDTGIVVLNNAYTGFYHTRYDSPTLQKLAKLVETNGLSASSRLGLLADNLALTKAGRQTTVDLVKLLEHYNDETAYPVWQSMFSVIGALRMIVNDDEHIEPYLWHYVERLITPEFKRLGWRPHANESYFDRLLRPDVISLMAYAKVSAVIDRLLAHFDAAKTSEDLDADIRSIIYAVAVRERGEPVVDQLLAWYKTASAEERINLAAGLTAVTDERLAQKLITHFTTKLIKPQDLSYWFSYLMRNKHGSAATWQWMQDNWDWITKRYKGDFDYTDFPKYSANAMSTRDQLEAYRAFFTPKLQETDIARTIRQGLEDIEVRVLWRERDLEAVTTFLKEQRVTKPTV